MNTNEFGMKHLNRMEQAVLDAGSYLVTSIESPEGISTWRKDDLTMVTTLDIESQRRILQSLGADLLIVSEEDEASHNLIRSATTYFLVDPLDGTSSCRRFMDSRGGHLGFGPLVGLVQDGRVVAATFYHLPERTLFSAVRGKGCYMTAVDMKNPHPAVLPELQQRHRLLVQDTRGLDQSALLFYPGNGGELRFVEYLRSYTPIENTYRFGGFANDCTRLARGIEQAQVQFSVKGWDFPAVLFAVEAGLSAIVDPLRARTPFDEWRVQEKNPVVTCVPSVMEDLMAALTKSVAT